MDTLLQEHDDALIEYPDCDGNPMSDNTLQFHWIVLIKENLETQFADDPNVFIAGDLLWYPVKGQPKVRAAPDAMAIFGRPKGYRGSYMQWVEGGIAPKAVFEILSPNNSREEMDRKFDFYEKHGVDEYYLFDPETNDLHGWTRRGGRLEKIANMNGWISPALGIRFELDANGLTIFHPDGTPFTSHLEEAREKHQVKQDLAIAEYERKRAEEQRSQAEQERKRAEAEAAAAVKLAAEQAAEIARLREQLKLQQPKT